MEKVKKIKSFLNRYNLDGYLVPKNDEFFGEYVPEEKDNLKFISNFSGSYGFALILKNKNYLFVDGRYTLQANIQSGKNFQIITLPQKFPKDILKNKKMSIGIDPKLHTDIMLKSFFKNTKCKLVLLDNNFINDIRIKKRMKKLKNFFLLPDRCVGQSSTSKIEQISKILNKKNLHLQFVSSSENIAWLLNLRGNDSEYTPLPNSYLILNNSAKGYLFCDLKKINSKVVFFKNIKILDITSINLFLSKIKSKKILIDMNTCSIFFKNIIKRHNSIVLERDPINLFKAIKNKTEIKNTIDSHLKDGAALTKFLFWVINNFKRKKITEISAQEKLLEFRKKIKDFKSLSFPTISSSGPNGSIIHYKAEKKSNRTLKTGEMYLVDSGAQYNYGTTDVTRTISLDSKNKSIKNIYTRVLKGHIAVSNYKINKHTCGSEIDVVARKPLNEINLDYPHGTGHGVGYFLNVHEGPHGISRGNQVTLREGMIISNEPGYYQNGKFGIRIENLITVKKIKNKLKFVDLTMVPIDKSMIIKKLLNTNEIKWINKYHKKVYVNLKKFMNKTELKQLKNSCSAI